jgi:hypothetical protein
LCQHAAASTLQENFHLHTLLCRGVCPLFLLPTLQGCLWRLPQWQYAGLLICHRGARDADRRILHHRHQESCGADSGKGASHFTVSAPCTVDQHECLCVVQVSNPSLTSGWAAAFSQTSTRVTLTVTRPLSHPTHPIAASGTTKVIYGTGPSLARTPISSHDENKEVGVVCHPNHHPSPLCLVDSSHPRQP